MGHSPCYCPSQGSPFSHPSFCVTQRDSLMYWITSIPRGLFCPAIQSFQVSDIKNVKRLGPETSGGTGFANLFAFWNHGNFTKVAPHAVESWISWISDVMIFHVWRVNTNLPCATVQYSLLPLNQASMHLSPEQISRQGHWNSQQFVSFRSSFTLILK